MKREQSKILLIDDQPAGIAWLKEYLESKGSSVVMEPLFARALDRLRARQDKFDLILIDLMMPTTGVDASEFAQKSTLYLQFPGLLLAVTARNFGYGSTRVLLYSVQDTDEIEHEAQKIGVGYFVKGRPRELKARIASIIS